MLLRAWLPFLSLLLQLAVVFAGAQWIDTSPRFPESAGFGYAFGVFIAAFLYASWPTVATFLLGLSATFAAERRRVLTLWSAGIAALWGIVVGGWGLAELLRSPAADDRAFGAVLVAGGLCAVVPLLFVPSRAANSA